MTDNLPHDSWIKISGLNFFHGKQEVLKDIELEFKSGYHYILAGANGAGKSTLFDLLAGLREPNSGRLSIMGHDYQNREPLKWAKFLALAPQDFRLNFSFTVRQVVGMGRRPYLGRWGRLTDKDHEAVEKAINALDLEQLAEKPVNNLSGGEKQRTIAARALAQESPILLLDEPTAGLDILHALKLMAVAKKKAEEGRLVITVTHDLNLAASFGHEFVFLKKGRLVATGSTVKVFCPEVLSEVYEAESQVSLDGFSNGLMASFRLPQNS